MENIQLYKSFKLYVLNRINDLITLNVEKSREIIDLFGKNEERNIINSLNV
jgi:hypothetical protein